MCLVYSMRKKFFLRKTGGYPMGPTPKLADPPAKLTTSGLQRWDGRPRPRRTCRGEDRPRHAFKAATASHGPSSRTRRDGMNGVRGRLQEILLGTAHHTGARSAIQPCFRRSRTFAIQAPRAAEQLWNVRHHNDIRPAAKRQRAILVRSARSVLENMGRTQ
jgi:hypothetical protein